MNVQWQDNSSETQVQEQQGDATYNALTSNCRVFLLLTCLLIVTSV